MTPTWMMYLTRHDGLPGGHLDHPVIVRVVPNALRLIAATPDPEVVPR